MSAYSDYLSEMCKGYYRKRKTDCYISEGFLDVNDLFNLRIELRIPLEETTVPHILAIINEAIDKLVYDNKEYMDRSNGLIGQALISARTHEEHGVDANMNLLNSTVAECNKNIPFLKWDDDMVKRVVTLKKEGYTLDRISSELGISMNRLNNFLSYFRHPEKIQKGSKYDRWNQSYGDLLRTKNNYIC